MTITEAQRQARRGSVGSSDIAAILGIHPNMTAADVWASKVFEMEESGLSGDWIEAGNALEPAILDWAGREIGKEIEKDPPTFLKPPHYHSNPDAMVIGEGAVLEAKTGQSEGWGEPGTDEIPPHILAQCQWHLFVCEKQTCYVAAALASEYGIRMRLYVVERDEEIMDGLRKRANSFWKEHVVPRARPGDVPPRLAMLKRIKKEPGSRVHVDPVLIDAWIQANKEKGGVERHEKRCRAALLEAMGTAESTHVDEWEITHMEQQRRPYQVAGGSYRVLRKKRRKEED